MSHAIVMGGSIAGLCAAAALAKNFDRVTVLERAPEPGPHARKDVPQGQHSHALMSRGQAIMNELFPGAFAALARDGAVRGDLGTTIRWFHFGAWKTKAPLGVDSWFQSRPLLEHHLRQSLKQNPRVELRFEVAVEAPIHADGRVTGLRLRSGSALHGDLIVDATGRGSRSPRWLEEWGYGRVAEQRVRVGLAYVSGTFESTVGSGSGQALAVYQHAATGHKRLGYCFPLENGRTMVTLAGYHGDHPPTKLGAFREWAKTLLQPDVADALAGLRLVGELHKFNYPEQVRRCYGSLRRLPEGYLIVGDAMCSFDPTFGQGMLVSALQAERLADRARPGRSSVRLQRGLQRVTDLPFGMTATEAHRWSETTGWRPPATAMQQAYFAKVFEAASDDVVVYRALVRAMHMLAPPTELLRPNILWRVLVRRRPSVPAIARPASPFAGELSSSAVPGTGY
jgi:2-polyprenyl-6-methoxyphenol hydroxylase-like FAD-dependent oxidoreductase